MFCSEVLKSPLHRMSILLIVSVCAAHPAPNKYIRVYDNGGGGQPIASAAQERRICAELCLSGFGGAPCGDSCLDISPKGMPPSSQSDAGDRFDGSLTALGTRPGACDVLCANNLGAPLCRCAYGAGKKSKNGANFTEICSFFCTSYDFKIYGCQACDTYGNTTKIPVNTTKTTTTLTSTTPTTSTTASTEGSIAAAIDWEEWCRYQCSVGEGGAACNCDILPIAAPFGAGYGGIPNTG